MLDFARFISRLGVGGDGLIMANQQQRDGSPPESYRNTFLFVQNSQPQQQQQAADQQQRGGTTKYWVNIIQHLIITSIQGAQELHADNMFVFGANLTELILSRCAPVQSSPAGNLVFESFTHVNEEVIPLSMSINKRPEYFVRAVQDYNALEFGLSGELPAVLGAHPPEDVMHLGAWIQLYSILNNGALPSRFDPFPAYNGRAPELVLGRRYPLVGTDPDTNMYGTILLDPNGLAHITTSIDAGPWTMDPPVSLDSWWKTLQEKELMVAPLIFRRHAAFRAEGVDRSSPPWVAINHRIEGRQFLTRSGHYLLSRGETAETQEVPFIEAHERLLPIGTHILVEREAIHHFGLTGTCGWVLGSLRYPDNATEQELSDANQHNIYLTIRMKVSPGMEQQLRLVYVAPRRCRILNVNDGIPFSSEALPYDMRGIMIGRNQ